MVDDVAGHVWLDLTFLTCGAFSPALAATHVRVTCTQGLTLLQISAQLKRFLWERATSRGCLRVFIRFKGV